MADRGADVNPFSYTEETLEEIERALSPERLHPFFMRNLTADHARILEVTGWISPGVRTWIAHHSRLPALLELPRDAGVIQF